MTVKVDFNGNSAILAASCGSSWDKQHRYGRWSEGKLHEVVAHLRRFPRANELTCGLQPDKLNRAQSYAPFPLPLLSSGLHVIMDFTRH